MAQLRGLFAGLAPFFGFTGLAPGFGARALASTTGLCGSGAGVSVAACKFPSIRAVVAHDTYTAHQSVEHDDCNILCLGGRVIGPALAADIIRSYLAAEFTGEDRHKRRLAKIDGIEREFLRDDI